MADRLVQVQVAQDPDGKHLVVIGLDDKGNVWRGQMAGSKRQFIVWTNLGGPFNDPRDQGRASA